MQQQPVPAIEDDTDSEESMDEFDILASDEKEEEGAGSGAP